MAFRQRYALAIVSLGSLFILSAKADLVATYTFNNTLNPLQGGVAALTAVDPLSTSGFQTATVFGNTQTTYHFDGSASPVTDQGGLEFNTTGLISSNDYSVEMVVELTSDVGWRRLLDSQDRQSDDGLYIDPSNNLDSYPNGGSGSLFTNNTFFDIFVTIDPSNTVTGYFSGIQEFSDTSTSLDITSDNILGFYLDNLVGGGLGEWSSGNVALIKIFNTALSPGEVAIETADPFQGTTAPEPATLALVLGAIAAVATLKGRRSLITSIRVRAVPPSEC